MFSSALRVTSLSLKVWPASMEGTWPVFKSAPKFPVLVKYQSANVRSFELSKETLRPQAFLSGLVTLGSRVLQLKPAWFPPGSPLLTTHSPAGRSDACWASFSTAPDLSRMPPVSVAAAASGATVLKDVTLSPLSARVIAETAATPLREERRHDVPLLCAFIPIDLSNATLCLAPVGKHWS